MLSIHIETLQVCQWVPSYTNSPTSDLYSYILICFSCRVSILQKQQLVEDEITNGQINVEIDKVQAGMLTDYALNYYQQ